MSEAMSDDDDLRAALSESYDKAVAKDEAPAETVEAAPEPAAEIAPEPQADAAPEADRPTDSRARAPDGKFTTAPKATPAKAEVKATAPPIGTPAAEPWAKAPASLKPEAREEWAKVPAVLQQDFHRREREIQVAQQRAAETTRQAEPLLRAVQPYAQQLAARGQSPDQVISNFLRTEQALSNPSESARAGVLLQAMRTYGVSVEALATALEGQGTPQRQQQMDPGAIAAQVEQAIMGKLNAERSQGALSRAATEIETFKGAGGGEFLDDLKGGVAARLGAGLATSLKEAYEQECWANPRIRGILQQREASKKAATGAQATQRARAASSSVRSDPGGAPNGGSPQVDTWEQALEAQFDRRQ